MTDESDDEAAGPDDDKVGYGKPPKHSRFQPGRSGNPRGRPKKKPEHRSHGQARTRSHGRYYRRRA